MDRILFGILTLVLLDVMTTMVLADDRVAVAELELLRVICATLRAPLPIFDLNRPGIAPT